MKVYFGTDHAGYELKNTLLAYVEGELGHEVVDCGAYEENPEDDYPAFVRAAAEAAAKDPHGSRAIVLGGSGEGEAMVANKVPGIRAAVYHGGNLDVVALSRTHNDANVLSLGARFMKKDEAKEAVRLWLETPFSGEARHARRIASIEESS
ncbi:MAG TPA: RpiB/LacA/LacB family sugar-phosphate isomerase [Candidatus Paceibacterota bacterium]|nr:RpiB/LacA/LacB family sugar-phosphate isomerase [Candidatus Paceibacterota bacterium]